MNRKHPRKAINIRKSTVDYLDKWLKGKHVNRTGLLEELALALAIDGGETKFFKIECTDLEGLMRLHPSADKAWSVMTNKVKVIVETVEHELGSEPCDRFYEECRWVGVSRKQADSVLKVIGKEEGKVEDGE